MAILLLSAGCDEPPVLAPSDAEIVVAVEGIPEDPGVTVVAYIEDTTPPNNRQTANVAVGDFVRFTDLGAGFRIRAGLEGLATHRCRIHSVSSMHGGITGQIVTFQTESGRTQEVRFSVRCLTATLELVVQGLPDADSALVRVPSVDPTAPGAGGAATDSIYVRNGIIRFVVLPRDGVEVIPRDIITEDGHRYAAAPHSIELPSRDTSVVVLDFVRDPPNSGTATLLVSASGVPADTAIAFPVTIRSRIPPFTSHSAEVKLGRGFRFENLADGIEYEVELRELARHACEVRNGPTDFVVEEDQVVGTVRVSPAPAPNTATFVLVCRSGVLDLAVSGLPAGDTSRVRIAVSGDTTDVRLPNGLTRVSVRPGLIHLLPQPHAGSDGLAYTAIDREVSLASRDTADVSLEYVAEGGGMGMCLAEGPLAWYRMDGTAADASGNGHDGTLAGPTAGADRFGAAGGALAFDGEDDRIDLGDSFNDLQLPFSITGWVYQPGSARENLRSILATDDEPDRYAGIWFQTDPMGRLSITYADGGAVGAGTRRTLDSDAPIPNDAWVHVTATVRGPTDMTLYVNGVAVAGTYSGTGGPLLHTDAPARIGAFSIVAANRPWRGLLDDLRIYACSLSASEVATLFGPPS